eukprot:12203592-Heterocapsa_arctica.AAC.1
MAEAATCLVRGLDELGSKMSAKSTALGQPAGLAHGLQSMLASRGIKVKVANTVRDLGIDATLATRRSTPTSRARTGKATEGWSRSRCWGSSTRRHRSFCRLGQDLRPHGDTRPEEHHHRFCKLSGGTWRPQLDSRQEGVPALPSSSA